jgi:hypothetical protein
LNYHGARLHSSTRGHIGYPQIHQVASPELAVYRQVEMCQVVNIIGQLQADTDRPYFLQLQRVFLTRKHPFVPGSLIAIG